MKTLIDKNRIQTRISEMALEIDEYYKKQDWYRETQEPVIVIGVLTGAMFFMVDLVRKLSIRTKLDFIRVSTYPGKTTIAQEPKIITPPTISLRNTHILLVDDILDTGKTIDVVTEQLAWPGPESIQTAVLLRKPGKACADITAGFVGFDVTDEWIIGMGLDYNNRYRELPYVAVWSEKDEFEAGEVEVSRSQ